MEPYFFSAKFFIYFSTLSPAHLFAKDEGFKDESGYKRGLQKFQFPNPLVDWEKFRSNAQACFQKTKFYIFIMNWEKLRNPTRATFKNPKISL